MSANNRIGYIEIAFTFASTTSFLIGFLPPNAYITDVDVFVTTDFTDGVLDVGDDATAALFADDISLNGTGKKAATSTAQWGNVQATSDQTQVKGIVVATGTGLAAGAAKVVVQYAYVD